MAQWQIEALRSSELPGASALVAFALARHQDGPLDGAQRAAWAAHCACPRALEACLRGQEPLALLVARGERSELAGLGAVGLLGNLAWVSLCVSSALGQGVGQALMGARLDWAREHGARHVLGEVFLGERASEAHLRRNGFYDTGRRRWCPAVPATLAIWAREL